MKHEINDADLIFVCWSKFFFFSFSLFDYPIVTWLIKLEHADTYVYTIHSKNCRF